MRSNFSVQILYALCNICPEKECQPDYPAFWGNSHVLRVPLVEVVMDSVSFPTMHEPFVDAERAAAFLAMSRKTVLALSRKGQLPGHPIGQGPRKIWRFRLSELSRWLVQEEVNLDSHRGRNERNNS